MTDRVIIDEGAFDPVPAPVEAPPEPEYTPAEYLALVVSRIIAQSDIVAHTVTAGREHPLGVYSNEYGRVIPIGKQQRKRLVGMILVGEHIQALTDAFVAVRDSPEGQALLLKTQAHVADHPVVVETEAEQKAN